MEIAKQMDTPVFCNVYTAEVSILQSTDCLDLDLVAAGRRGLWKGEERIQLGKVKWGVLAADDK